MTSFTELFPIVMTAFAAAIHTPEFRSECMDGRDKPGHDGVGVATTTYANG